MILPYLDGEAWTRVSFSNGKGSYTALPGITMIDSLNRIQKMDVRSSPLFEGATYINQGFEPSPVNMTVTMWLDEHIKKWFDEVLPVLCPSFHVNRIPTPINIIHPMLQGYGITRVVIREIGGLVSQGPGGAFTARIQTTEYRPQKKVSPASIAEVPYDNYQSTVDPKGTKRDVTVAAIQPPSRGAPPAPVRR